MKTVNMSLNGCYCDFCFDHNEVGHLCVKKFIFKNIFETFLMRIFLKYRPQNGIEFWRLVMDIIETENIFKSSPDPSEIAYENLIKFLDIYDCF